ncbi:MAG TPA: HisA/HisF-related TIM barrel protein, partial [Candidatus Limnocylindrales bacterium]
MSFTILPAIDLVGGAVVRLRRGDFDEQRVYSHDPVAVANGFADAGAEWLHIVDLDGARQGRPQQLDLAARIIEHVGDRVACELAGGLRSTEAVDAALRTGARRVVLGTAALREPEFVGACVERFGADRIVVALDVR